MNKTCLKIQNYSINNVTVSQNKNVIILEIVVQLLIISLTLKTIKIHKFCIFNLQNFLLLFLYTNLCL